MRNVNYAGKVVFFTEKYRKSVYFKKKMYLCKKCKILVCNEEEQ